MSKKQDKKKIGSKKKGKKNIKADPANSDEDYEDEGGIQFDTDSEPDATIGQQAPDSADAECMFCQELFSEDIQGETWIKCLICGLWAHNDCAGSEIETWVCDFCK